ncbi:MAG: DNA repair protein RadC [Leptospiraceae bacterium]|nr:DNA repair protein RadC [Leptospiraceae bacterium]MCB1171839.1 DNA repair protein RadC [Leptospiraceae bacterium]
MIADGPREKLLQYGVERLSDKELLMLILGRGSRRKRLAPLATSLLKILDQNPGPDLHTLCGLDGIHNARAAMLLAMLEFGRRKHGSAPPVAGPEDAFQCIRHLGDRNQEHFLALTLAGNGALIRRHTITIGLVNRTLIHPREVFAPAVADRAASLIVAHNHPSGDLEPSEEDRRITSRLQDCGEMMGIPVLDHIVFHSKGFRSILQ